MRLREQLYYIHGEEVETIWRKTSPEGNVRPKSSPTPTLGFSVLRGPQRRKAGSPRTQDQGPAPPGPRHGACGSRMFWREIHGAPVDDGAPGGQPRGAMARTRENPLRLGVWETLRVFHSRAFSGTGLSSFRSMRSPAGLGVAIGTAGLETNEDVAVLSGSKAGLRGLKPASRQHPRA